MSDVLFEKKDGIAYVILNRPSKRNAMSFELLHSLIVIAGKITRDKSIRVVIIHGAEGSFSSGIDLDSLNNPKSKWLVVWELLKPGQSFFQKACLVWQELPVPVIAAIEGPCFGAGMQLALAADIRIAANNSQLAILEGKWGLVPDMGISHTLRSLVALDVIKELTFSARIVSGGEAKTLGLVSHLAENPIAAATALAGELAARSPDSVMASKRVLNAMVLTPHKASRMEKIWQLKLLAGKNRAIAKRMAKDATLAFLPRQFK